MKYQKNAAYIGYLCVILLFPRNYAMFTFPDIKTELIPIVLFLSLSGQRTVTNDKIWNE